MDVHTEKISLSCINIALALWIGGRALLAWAIVPACFRAFGKERAGEVLDIVFVAVARWNTVWASVACALAYLLFLGRHFEWRSLAIELPLVGMVLMEMHLDWHLLPQIRNLRHQMQQPQYQGTARLERIRFLFQRWHRQSVRLHMLILAGGLFVLAQIPRLLGSP